MTLAHMMAFLKIPQTKPSTSTNKRKEMVNISIKEFIADRSRHWFNFFNHRIIRKMKRKNSFYFEIKTDGIGASVLYGDKRPPPPEDFEELMDLQSKKYKFFGDHYDNNRYEKIIGIDPGYKLYLAAMIKNLEIGDESLYKLTSRKYYNLTKENIRH